MRTLTVGKFKSEFSSVLETIREGEEVVLEFGKTHEKIAVLVPYDKFVRPKRKVGILEGKGSFKMKSDFKMTEEEFIGE